MILHTRSLLIGIGITACIAALAAFLLWPKPQAQSYIAPVIPEPTPAPIANAPAKPIPQPDLILDLFEPTPDMLDAQQAASGTRNQIEHALTVTFLLTRCNYFSQQEYSDTYNALIRFAQESGLAANPNAAALEIRNLATSAGASYSLVYSRVPCDTASLTGVASQLRQWRDQSSRIVSKSSSTP